MSKKLDHVYFPSIIELNVGGHRFTTSLRTLTKDTNSMLAAMFSGRYEIERYKDGAFFINRDGTHFRFILNYLRNGELILPDGATFLKELKVEAKFYLIQGILDELVSKGPQNFEESVIWTNEEHRSVLSGWLPQQDGKWQFLCELLKKAFKLKLFIPNVTTKGPLSLSWRAGTIFSMDSLKYGGAVSILISSDRVKKRYFWSNLAGLNINKNLKDTTKSAK